MKGSQSSRQVWRNALWLYVAQGLNLAFPILIGPYLFRSLGHVEFGRVAFAQAFVGLGALFVNFGFDWSGSRAIAKSGENRRSINRAAGEFTAASLLLTTVPLVLIPAGTLVWSRFGDVQMLVIAAFGVVIGNAAFPSWLFLGRQRMALFAGITASGRLLALALVLSFVHGPDDSLLFCLILSAQWLVIAALGWWSAIVLLGVTPVWSSLQHVRKRISDGLRLALSSLTHRFYTAGNALLLGFVASFGDVGIYAAAERLTLGASAVLGPIPQAILPQLADEDYRLSREGRRTRRLAATGVIAAGALLGMTLFIGAPVLGVAVFGGEFAGGTRVLRALGIAIIPSSIGYAVSHMYLIPAGLDRALARAVTVGAAVDVLLVLFLGGGWGAEGAAVAFLCGETTVTLLLLASFRRRIPLDRDHLTRSMRR